MHHPHSKVPQFIKHYKRRNMQLKVVSALALATLVAAQPSGPTILPPFPGNPLPVVRGSDCSNGRLECCRFYSTRSLYTDCSAMMKSNYYYRRIRPGTHLSRCFRRPLPFRNRYRLCWWSCWS